MKKGNFGFSLIELMIVVAIVAFLAAITMGYLGSARKKGDDTAVKSNLATLRSISELFFLENGNTYLPSGGSSFGPATCPSYNVSGTNMFSANKPMADSIAEATLRGVDNSCANNSSAWAVAVGLKENPGTSWCVDTQGSAKIVQYAPSAAINPSTFSCN